MVSVKYALILVVGFVAGASIFASPVPQAIAAVIATDVQCTGCVGAADLASSAVTTTKLASNSVNGGKISDGTISAADLGPDSVGASEIKGISKLIFADCSFSESYNAVPGQNYSFTCSVPGAAAGDNVLANVNTPSCMVVSYAKPGTDSVLIGTTNNCNYEASIGTQAISVMVYNR